jgi:glycerol-3-phosphate dehydrogenase (NAD(P)+)
MTKITVAGAGAFGTALALALDQDGREVTLMGRDMAEVSKTRISARLGDVEIPHSIELTQKLSVGREDILLLAVPMQSLAGFLHATTPAPMAAIACCKGIDLASMQGPTAIIAQELNCPAAVLTGPSFAKDIAAGLPTALTLATDDTKLGGALQEALSTESLRLYLSNDPIGAELGGALKNVIAIACGICMGAKLGESARAALMTRGFAEMQRLAVTLGAQAETLSGLSGFGDMALTCTSAGSRNYAYGFAMGAGETLPEDTTVEGKATAKAVVKLAKAKGTEMPIAKTVVDMLEGHATLDIALAQLLSRPLGKE